MANVDTPFGFKPIEHLNGNPWNGKTRVYYIPATDNTAVFVGDPVKSAGSADTTGRFPTIAQAAAGDLIRGVVVGFDVRVPPSVEDLAESSGVFVKSYKTIYDLIDIAESYNLDIENGINLRKLTYDQLVELIVESGEHYVVEDNYV